MVTAKRIRIILRKLKPSIDLISPVAYEDLLFAISDFEIYLSGDEYADGNELFVLKDKFEDVIYGLWEKSQEPYLVIDTESILELEEAIKAYMGELPPNIIQGIT